MPWDKNKRDFKRQSCVTKLSQTRRPADDQPCSVPPLSHGIMFFRQQIDITWALPSKGKGCAGFGSLALPQALSIKVHDEDV